MLINPSNREIKSVIDQLSCIAWKKPDLRKTKVEQILHGCTTCSTAPLTKSEGVQEE